MQAPIEVRQDLGKAELAGDGPVPVAFTPNDPENPVAWSTAKRWGGESFWKGLVGPGRTAEADLLRSFSSSRMRAYGHLHLCMYVKCLLRSPHRC